MIISKQNEIRYNELGQQVVSYYQPSFEVKLEQNIQVSDKAYASPLKVDSPVERATVVKAASLLKEMMLAASATTVYTQANVDRQKAALLLADE